MPASRRGVTWPIVATLLVLRLCVSPAVPATAQDFSLDRRYDQYAYLTSHNSFANDEEDYLSLLANQSRTVLEQLSDGVRCLMFDTYLARQRSVGGTRLAELYTHSSQTPSSEFFGIELEVVVAHNPDANGYSLLDGYPLPGAYPDFRKLREDLARIKLWMALHPREIVTIVLESGFVDPPMMMGEFEATGMAEMIFWADRPNPNMFAPDGTLWEVGLHGWPTVGLMADVGRRLVVFSNRGEEADGLPHQWDFMSENVFGDDSLFPDTCAERRADSLGLDHKSNSLLFVNSFPTFNAFGDAPFDDLNDAGRITQCLGAIRDETARPPNYLSVDHYHAGAVAPQPPFAASGPAQVVASLNATLWPSVSAIVATHSLSPPPNAAGWHRAPVTAFLDGITSSGTIEWVEYDIRGSSTISSHAGGPVALVFQIEGDYLVNYQAVGSLENRSDAQYFRVHLDLEAPVTQVLLSPAEAAIDWTGEPVLVELVADDPRSGVESTWLAIDGGAAIAYEGAFELTSDKLVRLDYWSVDVAGNVETVRSMTIPACPLDLDRNRSLDAATDGVYGFRALLGLQTIVPSTFRVLDPSIPPDPAIADAVLFLDDALDVDADGSVRAATDGVYVFRRLLGLQSIVPLPFRQLDPSILPDHVIAANIDALCGGL
jgi:hypothetical protein